MARTNLELTPNQVSWVTKGATSNTGLTAGGLTVGVNGAPLTTWSKYSWTNAMVVALGATTTGNLTVCTLPAKTVVLKAVIVVTGTAANVTALTLAMGRTATAYIDYIIAKDAKVAANTVYGQVFANLGANLSALIGDLPSLTTTTDVKLQFISTPENLSAVTGSTGDIYLQTITLP